MPSCKASEHQPDYPRDHGQHHIVDGHQRIRIFSFGEDLSVDPVTRHPEIHEAEESRVNEEQQEGLVISQSYAGRQPWTMVVHL